ncbi:MAG: AAA family ATPase, partial [Bradyrhizobium sp.]
MKLQIERPTIEAMAAAFPHLTPLKEQLRFGDKVEVNVAQLAGAELEFLRDVYQKAGPEWHARAAHIATL